MLYSFGRTTIYIGIRQAKQHWLRHSILHAMHSCQTSTLCLAIIMSL